MQKLQSNQLHLIKSLFESYSSNRAIIFSVFEGWFNGCAYVNDINNTKWALLQTPFLQNFIAGEPIAGCEDVVSDILFNSILSGLDEKELVAFSDTDKWNDILDSIFQKRNGVSDGRKIFKFSRENYESVSRASIPEGLAVVVEKRKATPFSLRDTLSAKLIINGHTVSFCNACMIGDNKAELDVFTDEAFRGRGYAFLSATLLIDELLNEGLTPTWSTWPFRKESQRVAEKLGFIPQPDAKAWIWQEGM